MHYTRVKKKVCCICCKPIEDEGNFDRRRHDQCVEDKLAMHKPTPDEIAEACLLIREMREEEKYDMQAIESRPYYPKVAQVNLHSSRRGRIREV